MKTCDQCKHYTPSCFPEMPDYVFAGECALMTDSNCQSPRNNKDKCSGWDHEGYQAGVYVGPKFGCIHWEKKQ